MGAPADTGGGGTGGGGTHDKGALRLEEAAVRHGAYRWVEQRLFELTGTWAAAPGLPEGARVSCFEASAQHAWHAELWEARLPVLAGVDHERLTRPVGRMVAPLLGSLEPGAWDGDEESGGRRFCVGMARVVLPLLFVSYRRHGAQLVPVADGPAIRALTLVVRDLSEELEAFGTLADELSRGKTAAQDAAAWVRTLGGVSGDGGAEEELLPWSEADFAW